MKKQSRKKVKQNARSDAYSRYLKQARIANVPEESLFKRGDFSHVRVAMRAKNMDFTAEELANYQGRGNLTTKQVNAMYNASQRINPNKYQSYEDFLTKQGYKDVDKMVADITAANPQLSSHELSLLITRTVYSGDK